MRWIQTAGRVPPPPPSDLAPDPIQQTPGTPDANGWVGEAWEYDGSQRRAEHTPHSAATANGRCRPSGFGLCPAIPHRATVGTTIRSGLSMPSLEPCVREKALTASAFASSRDRPINYHHHHHRRHPLRPAGPRRSSGCERHAYPRHAFSPSDPTPNSARVVAQHRLSS
jgi:hypothetical protein